MEVAESFFHVQFQNPLLRFKILYSHLQHLIRCRSYLLSLAFIHLFISPLQPFILQPLPCLPTSSFNPLLTCHAAATRVISKKINTFHSTIQWLLSTSMIESKLAAPHMKPHDLDPAYLSTQFPWTLMLPPAIQTTHRFPKDPCLHASLRTSWFLP